MIRVDFITLSRSDYSSLRPVALAALDDPEIDVKLIAGGSHLLERFGRTIDSIIADGFPSIEKIDFLNADDNSDSEMAAAYGRAVQGFEKLLGNDRPDFIFLVGDRWEMLAPVTVASMLRIPIAHHSGGDITQGSADNQTRYVLTTLSHLHFTALEEHADRLIRMGEEPWRVRVTGEPALTALGQYGKNNSEVRASLNLKKNEPFVLATFHPTSYDELPLADQIELFIQALDLVEESLVITAPNPDPGSAVFLESLSRYAQNHERVHLVKNLGPERYYAAMAQAQFMIGNSSSGLWEAPSFGLPVVNIGHRQDGRVRGANVLDAGLNLSEIRIAIGKARDSGFRKKIQGMGNPYVNADTIDKILRGLKEKRSRADWLAKVFTDPLKIAEVKPVTNRWGIKSHEGINPLKDQIL